MAYSGNSVTIGGMSFGGRPQSNAPQIATLLELETYLRERGGKLFLGSDGKPVLEFTEAGGRRPASTIAPLPDQSFFYVQITSRDYVSIIPEADSLLLQSNSSYNVRIPLRFIGQLIERGLSSAPQPSPAQPEEIHRITSLAELESFLSANLAQVIPDLLPILDLSQGSKRCTAMPLLGMGMQVVVKTAPDVSVTVEDKPGYVNLLSQSYRVSIPQPLITALSLKRAAALANANANAAPSSVYNADHHFRGNVVKVVNTLFKENVYVECEPEKGVCEIDLTGCVIEKNLYIVDSLEAIQKAKLGDCSVSVVPPTFNFPNLAAAHASAPKIGARGRIDGLFHIYYYRGYVEGIEARITGGVIKGDLVFQNCTGYFQHDAPANSIKGKVINGIEEVD